MKRIAITLIALFMVVGLYAQTTGPVAKNAKPWETKKGTAGYYVNTNTNKPTGPATKNMKPGEVKASQDRVLVKMSAQPKLVGPAAKNAVPGK